MDVITDFKKFVNFTAIDFETANAAPSSICQIGLVRIEGGEIVHKYNQLIQPPMNSYNFYNTRVHGIEAHMTSNAPYFDEVWHDIKPYIEQQNVVAHNISFDSNCLNKTLKHYNLPKVNYKKICTVKIYKRNLAFVCEKYGIELKHHDALSDANACALLFLNYLKESYNGGFKLRY